MQATLTLAQAAQMVVAWSLVHGFAMLLLDDRLKQLIAKLPPGVDEMALLPAILSACALKTNRAISHKTATLARSPK